MVRLARVVWPESYVIVLDQILRVFLSEYLLGYVYPFQTSVLIDKIVIQP